MNIRKFVNGNGVIETSALQQALDKAKENGGASLMIPNGVYMIDGTLIIHSNTHLYGESSNAIIREVPAEKLPNGQRQGTGWYKGVGTHAALCAVGESNILIENLTIDLSNSPKAANGISFLPEGANSEGTTCSYCEVRNCRIIGGHPHHQYMLWNLRGRHMKFTHNYVDGGCPGPFDINCWQEGIETYDGEDVLIAYNLIENVGNNAINLSVGNELFGRGIRGVNVIYNRIKSNGRSGIFLGTACDKNGTPQHVCEARLNGNNIDGPQIGISLWNDVSCEMEAVSILDNCIRNAAEAGIKIYGKGGQKFMKEGRADPTVRNKWAIQICNNFVLAYPNQQAGCFIAWAPEIKPKDNDFQCGLAYYPEWV